MITDDEFNNLCALAIMLDGLAPLVSEYDEVASASMAVVSYRVRRIVDRERASS